MILAFDTETTGLPDFKQPSDAPHQPHLVQLAMVLLDDDLTERASACLVVRPDGWTIPDDIAKIHGITTEIASAIGVPEKVATDLYVEMQYGTNVLALAHNVSFDLRIMRIAMLRHHYSKEWQEARPLKSYCTMTVATPIVNIPPTEKMVRAGFNKPKAPRLTECMKHFFNEDFTGAHDAMNDVRATLRLYKYLKDAAETA